MKKVNWDNSRIRSLVDRETPFMEIEFLALDTGEHMIRLYWTKGGAYGPQVASLIYGGDDVLYSVTGGCGYNKTHAALETCFDELGHAPRGFDKSQDLYPYHVGGNYYCVSEKDWMES